MKIERPELSKVQGRHAIKVKASTECYHIIKVDVGTTFEPVLGSKEQADYFLNYLISAFDNEQPSKMDAWFAESLITTSFLPHKAEIIPTFAP